MDAESVEAFAPTPTGSLQGQVAIVTGASRGIGKAISLAIARAGAQVVLVARAEKRLVEVQQEIERAGGHASIQTADLRSEDDIRWLFAYTQNAFGRLDVLVNNAGIGRFGPLADFATHDLDEVLMVNLRGTYLCCREAMKLMIPRRHGYIINISSVVGFKGYPSQSAYTAAKHGVMGITKSLAAEAQRHDIRVSAVLPGGVDTELATKARPDLDRAILLNPHDVAATVMFLLSLSDRASIDEIYIRRRTSTPF